MQESPPAKNALLLTIARHFAQGTLHQLGVN